MSETQLFPEWKEIHKKLKDLDYGTFISYEQLNDMLFSDEDIRDKRHIIDRVDKELLTKNNKKLECVREKGYRIIHPNEHFDVLQERIKKARRNVAKGELVVAYTNTEELTTKEKAKLEQAQIKTAHLHGIMILHEKQLTKIKLAPFKQHKLPKP